ncbi:unnamed protein product [Rhizophagus irregularis]|nr:unnamed protein product [Rhizophagus irregularis]
MNSNNLNEDFYQTAINYYGIKEILENFGNEKERIGQGSCIVYKTKCESLGGILIAIKEVNITSDDCKNRTIKTLLMRHLWGPGTDLPNRPGNISKSNIEFRFKIVLGSKFC